MANKVEKVLSINHINDKLFSFRTTRDSGFRFLSGQFVMIGLLVNGKPLMRAYSLVNPYYSDYLEFLSIKVDNGQFTTLLKEVKIGDEILVGSKASGTLVIDNLSPGKRLYLLATGTGLAPFMSLIHDPSVFEKFGTVVLVHGCRSSNDLAYFDYINNEFKLNELVGDNAPNLKYYPIVSREPYANHGRITDHIASGELFNKLNVPTLNHVDDRIMICGNSQMLSELCDTIERIGFTEGNSSNQGTYVIEKAFVQK